MVIINISVALSLVSLRLTIVVINVKEVKGLDNLVLARSCVSLPVMPSNAPILSVTVIEGESGAFATISISERKRVHEKIKSYKLEFLRQAKNEVN